MNCLINSWVLWRAKTGCYEGSTAVDLPAFGRDDKVPEETRKAYLTWTLNSGQESTTWPRMWDEDGRRPRQHWGASWHRGQCVPRPRGAKVPGRVAGYLACSTLLLTTIKNVSRHYQCPLGTKSSLTENHSVDRLFNTIRLSFLTYEMEKITGPTLQKICTIK